jgi:ATP-dependent Clp protease adaptor protein ClpS
MSESQTPTAKPRSRRQRRVQPAKPRPQKLPPWNVVLLDDDDHTYPYVVEMLASVFAYPANKGWELARRVDRDGRVILCTTHKEKAELKRDQVLAYGRDWRIARCAGSMSCIIEPAPQ